MNINKLISEKDYVVKPTNDLAFKLMLGDERPGGKERMIDLVESLLNIKVDDLQYLDREIDGSEPGDKKTILDIRVLVNCDIDVDVEMQMIADPESIEARSLFYTARRIVVQVKEGQEYEAMNAVKTIFFVKNGLKMEGEGYIRHIRLRDEFGRVCSNGFEIILVDLNKFAHMAHSYEKMSQLDKWCYFLVHCNEEDEIMLQLRQDNDILRGAELMMKELTRDDIIREEAFRREIFEHDMASARYHAERRGMEEGLAKGMEEGKKIGLEMGEKKGLELGEKIGLEQGLKHGLKQGLEQGVAQGKAEVARKLLEKGMAVELIAETTGLSEEEIRKL